MPEMLKREVSLAVLHIRLLESSSYPTPGATEPYWKISCELEITGNVQERGFAASSLPPQEPPSSNRRRKHGARAHSPSTTTVESSTQPRVLAQWIFAPKDMQLPLQYDAAVRFNDKPSVFASWLGNLARRAASVMLSQMNVDALERLAAGVNWLPSGSPTLPSAMVRQLQVLLPTVMHEHDCLWIEIKEPTGYLPLLPWEEMLRSVTSAPILRLSPHDVKSQSGRTGLQVALCLTVPSNMWLPTPEALAALMQQIVMALPERSTLHIFADDLCYPIAQQVTVAVSGSQGRSLKIYPPPEADAEIDPNDFSDPWRKWLGECLLGTAVDIFHCLAPGLFFADNVRLVIARWPRCNRSASGGKDGKSGRPLRYVTAAELSQVLTAFGAWGVIFSTPMRGSWLTQARLGLRLLADLIGRLRPGAIVFHDTALDTQSKAIAETYAFLIGDPSIRASTSPAISLYCHPSRAVAVATEPASLPPELLDEYAKIKNVMEEITARGQPLPGWMAATQRVVEHAMSRASAVGAQGIDRAAVRGVAAALKYIDQMLSERALQLPVADQARNERGNGSG